MFSCGSLDSEFTEKAQQELERCQGLLAELEAQIADLGERRTRMLDLIGHLSGIVMNDMGAGAPSQDESGVGPKLSDARALGADQVFEYLVQRGSPAHYKEIHEAFRSRGYVLGGKDPASTFLSRYYNDPRLTRVARGTYAVRDSERLE